MLRANCAAIVAVVCAVSTCLSTTAVRADLVVEVRQGATTLRVEDNSLNDLDLAPGSINVSESALTSAFTDLDTGSAVSATSNFFAADSFGNLQQTVRLIRDDIAGVLNLTYTVVATQTGFLFPAEPSKVLTAAATATFTNSPPANTVTFTGAADPLDTEFGLTVSGTGGPIASSSPFGENGDSVNIGPLFFSDTGTYSLTSQNLITTTENSQIQVISTVRVDAAAIPEPGSLLLTGILGGFGVVVGSVRRRRR